jgi:hypothetical protein
MSCTYHAPSHAPRTVTVIPRHNQIVLRCTPFERGLHPSYQSRRSKTKNSSAALAAHAKPIPRSRSTRTLLAPYLPPFPTTKLIFGRTLHVSDPLQRRRIPTPLPAAEHPHAKLTSAVSLIDSRRRLIATPREQNGTRHGKLPSLVILMLISKDVDTDTSMRDSGIDTDYTSDMESITSSTYAHTYGKRRSECSPLDRHY